MSYENKLNNFSREILGPKEGKIKGYEKKISEEYAIRMKKLKENDNSEDSVLREELHECEPEIEILEELFEYFEDKYSVEELKKIVVNTIEEAANHPLRAPAREALKPINILLEKIKRETDITPGKIAELETKYKELSNAIGFFNTISRKLEHDR